MTCRLRTLRTIVVAGLFASGASAGGQTGLPPRPVPGPAPTATFPVIASITLANGLRLAVVENHTLPIVAVRFGLAGGPLLDAPGKEGCWALMTTLLAEGTMTRSAASIGDARADLGTQIGWSNTAGLVGSPSFTTARAEWKGALELVADMLRNPTFPSDAFARAQGVQSATAARLTQPVAAFRILNRTLYGENSPYGRTATESSIRGLTRDDVIAMHTTFVRPQNTVVVIVGDLTLAAARAAVEQAFGSWERSGTTVATPVASPAFAGQTTIFLHDDPGAATSAMFSGLAVPSHSSPDAAALEGLNAVVSAPFVSRLWHVFRTERGLTYTPDMNFVWRPEPQAGVWNTRLAGLMPTRTDTAVTEWLRVLRELRTSRPLTPDELDLARKSLVGALPNQTGTINGQAITTLSIVQNNLPLTYFNDYVARVNALTLTDLQRAAMTYLDIDHMPIVVVGDRAKIEAPLRATGIPVVIVP